MKVLEILIYIYIDIWRKLIVIQLIIYPLIILTDGWTTEDLQYLWKKDEPVQIVKDLHLPRVTLEKYISDYCNIETNTGKNEQPTLILINTLIMPEGIT